MAEQLKHPLIIGLTGYAKSGKDTCAAGICDAIRCADSLMTPHVKSINKFAFADPIREIGRMFGFTAEQLSDQRLKETFVHPDWGITPRTFMQRVGSDMFRNNLHADCWVMLMKQKLMTLIKDCEENTRSEPACLFTPTVTEGNLLPRRVAIISDVRFPNEADMVRNLGGIIIRVNRPSMVTSGEWKNHESERHISTLNADIDFYNTAPTADAAKLEAGKMFKEVCKDRWNIIL